jgi:diacylglycerol kinase family enzyme
MRRLSRYGWRAAERSRRPVLFVNPRSGGGRATQAGLVERAREREINAVVLGPHHDLAALVDEAVADGADALGVAGGDGSLGVAAAAARAHGLPFVCIPAGTRNHFALDLGVDRHDLVGALETARSRSWRSSPRSHSSAARSTSPWRSSCGACSMS